METKIIACNNTQCIKNEECKRYILFKNGAKEFTSNAGTKNQCCKKFIQNI